MTGELRAATALMRANVRSYREAMQTARATVESGQFALFPPDRQAAYMLALVEAVEGICESCEISQDTIDQLLERIVLLTLPEIDPPLPRPALRVVRDDDPPEPSAALNLKGI